MAKCRIRPAKADCEYCDEDYIVTESNASDELRFCSSSCEDAFNNCNSDGGYID